MESNLQKLQIKVTNPFNEKQQKSKIVQQQTEEKVQTIENNDFPIPEKLPPRRKVQCRPYFEFLKISDLLPAPQQIRRISPEQLSEHGSQQSAWICIDSIVYDVTTYLPYHPGGDIILAGCGKDGTSLFNKYHAFVNHSFLLQKYKIGVLIRKTKPFLQ